MRSLPLLLISSLAVTAFAQSPLPDPVVGTRPEAFSARSLGLGRSFVTTETGPAALLGNPATMAQQDSRWVIDLSGDVSRVREIRKYPFYDSFDGVLGYNNYAVNDHLYSKLDGGAAFRVPTAAVRSLVVAAGSYSAYRFDYRYHEEVRDRYASGGLQDRKLGENRLDITGDLRSITLGAAARMHGPLSLGFSFSMLSGEWTYEKSTYYATADSLDIPGLVEYSTDGMPAEAVFGAAWELTPRVTLGARALLPTGDFKFTQDVVRDEFFAGVDSVAIGSGTIRATYPGHYAAGVQYRPRSEFRSLLSLECEYHTYSAVSDRYDDSFAIRAGAEQAVLPGAPVRIGFIYATSPLNKERATTLFTAGIGFRLQKLSGDFGVEIGKMSYLESDLFPQRLFGDDNRTDFDRVETALFRGLISLRYTL